MKLIGLLPLILLPLIPFLFGGLSACDSEPEIITKTDTLVIVDTLTIIDIQDLHVP